MKKTTIGALSALSLIATANAAVIVGVNSISFTGTATEETALGLDNENQLIDGSGMTGLTDVASIATSTHAAVTTGNAWSTNAPGGGSSDYYASNGGASVSFELLLDNTYDLTDLATWAYGFGTVNDNNVSAVTVEYGVGNFGSTTGSLAIAEAASAGGSVTTSLGATITADRVRLTFTDNHFAPAGDGGDRASLAEVRLVGDVVPEPSSTALLGLGGLALILRRRK